MVMLLPAGTQTHTDGQRDNTHSTLKMTVHTQTVELSKYSFCTKRKLLVKVAREKNVVFACLSSNTHCVNSRAVQARPGTLRRAHSH